MYFRNVLLITYCNVVVCIHLFEGGGTKFFFILTCAEPLSNRRKITVDDLLESSSPRVPSSNLRRGYYGLENDSSLFDAPSSIVSFSSLPASGIVAAQSQSFLNEDRLRTPNSVFPKFPPCDSLLSPGSSLVTSVGHAVSESSSPSAADISSSMSSTSSSSSSAVPSSFSSSPVSVASPPSPRSSFEPAVSDVSDEQDEMPLSKRRTRKVKRKAEATGDGRAHRAKRSKTRKSRPTTNPPPLRLNGPAFKLLDNFVSRRR